MNNFKKLQEEEEEAYKKNVDNLKLKIDGNMNTLGVFSTVVDMYFSKVINYVVSLSGGTIEEDTKDQKRK